MSMYKVCVVEMLDEYRARGYIPYKRKTEPQPEDVMPYTTRKNRYGQDSKMFKSYHVDFLREYIKFKNGEYPNQTTIAEKEEFVSHYTLLR